MKILFESDLLKSFPEEDNQYLFHYTAYPSALNILLSQQLRLGSLEKMNDPLEFEDHHGQPLMYQGERSEEEYEEMVCDYEGAVSEKERSVRFASFSMDRYPCCNNFSKGWARSRMWAQYADNHKGVCLVFDKTNLIKTFESSFKNDVCRAYCKEIDYTNNLQPLGDTLSLPCKSLLTEDKIEFLFQKCEDFRDEQEFRLLLINTILRDSKEMVSFSIADSICGVITGVRFSTDNKPALKRAVESCNPAIKFFTMSWHYGMPGIWKDP